MVRLRKHIELSFAVRFRVVCKYSGQLCLIAAALALVPMAVSLWNVDYGVAVRYVMVVAALGGFGLLAARLQAPRRLQRNEAFAIVASIFLITSLAMTLPMTGSGLSFMDALFESVSATTTTGLSTSGTVEDKSTTFLFARAWMQWYGGLGVVVLSLGLAMQPGVVARRLAITQSDDSDVLGGTRAHARRIFMVFFALTVLGVLALWLLGASFLDAVTHAMAAVSTGGFSTYDDSLAGLGGLPLQAATIFLGLTCSISLPFYWRFGRNGWRELLRDWQLWTIVVLGITVAAGICPLLRYRSGMTWPEAAQHATLTAFSAQTTSGFSTTDVAQMDAGSKLLLILSMAIGGGTQSTAGGFKVLRLLILLQLLHGLLLKTALPKHAVYQPRVAGRRLESAEIEGALLIVALFFIVVIVSWLPFVVYGYDPLDSLFEVVSATGTVGLSAGISSPGLPPLLKGVLCVDMLLGRLEMVALLVMVYPRTWIGKRAQTS